MKPILGLFLCCLLAACASGPVVETDRDPEAAFGRLADYAWKQPPPISSPLLRQRVVAAIDAELAARGWRLVPEADADLVLVGNVSARDEQSISAFYDGPDWNEWEWRHAAGPNAGPHRVEVHTFKVGTLVLDMFDASTRKAVWRAKAEGTVPDSEAQRDKDALTAVHAMFVDFPAAATAPE